MYGWSARARLRSPLMRVGGDDAGTFPTPQSFERRGGVVDATELLELVGV
ncbi:MAG: hypothetical protein F7C09_04615 [Aeropyrum sp.]|nr:hypothetical protein [Aeropyrum sp.]